MGIRQVGIRQVRPGQDSTEEAGSSQVGALQVGARQVGTNELAIGKVGLIEVGTAEIRVREYGPGKVCTRKVSAAERPCCMDQPVDAVIPCPRGLMRCGRSSGVPAPAYGSGRRQQLPLRPLDARWFASAAHDR